MAKATGTKPLISGGRHSPYANTINGNLVSHQVAKEAYRLGILDKKLK